MKLIVTRYNSDQKHTNGALLINGRFACYTLEDQYQASKVHSETRIPDGIYKIGLRTIGGFHSRYLSQYGSEFHKGMLQILDVPGFEYILIHAGNTDKDTAGCLLVGMTNEAGANYIGKSREAYKLIYPKILQALQAGEVVEIEFLTVDKFEQ